MRRSKIRGLAFLLIFIILGFLFFNANLEVSYKARAALYGWAGDTQFYEDRSSVLSKNELHQLRDLLEPGDIILTRFEGYISNLLIPGYWTHAALYIGRERSFINQSFEKAIPYSADLIEAISEGVIFNNLDKCLDADGIAILRPRISQKEKLQAIEFAVNQVDKPYDFDFDCNTDARIYCSELIYKSYQPHTDIPSFDLFGRKYITADELYQYTVINKAIDCCLTVVFVAGGGH